MSEPAERPAPRSSNRRRLLIGAGFGAANFFLARALPSETRGISPAPEGGPWLPAPGTGLDELLDGQPASEPPSPDHVFDVVIRRGRIIDPATGTDMIGDVGIDGGTVIAVGGEGFVGGTVINAEGKIVAPGFIDLLSAEPNGYGEWFKLGDGVTTNLAMHGVNNYANAFFGAWEGRVPLHFGGAFHQQFTRHFDPDIAAEADESLDDAQLDELVRVARDNLDAGFAGICCSPEYAPGTTYEEMRALAELAAEMGHITYFHLRYSEVGRGPEGVAEALQLANDTGCSVHLAHLSSTGATETAEMTQVISMVEQATAEGLDISACVYPYDFWATTLGSSRFGGDWPARYGITYEDLEVAGEGRRLTAATFPAAQSENLLVAAHGTIPEATIELALAQDWVLIGSDAILTQSLNNHPRATGCFARVLGTYVRDRGVLSWSDALAKMTILPARRFQHMLPDLARKGRLSPGADADVVVFDPETVGDVSTVANPDQMSAGFSDVLIEGTPVISNGVVDRSQLLGRALRSA